MNPARIVELTNANARRTFGGRSDEECLEWCRLFAEDCEWDDLDGQAEYWRRELAFFQYSVDNNLKGLCSHPKLETEIKRRYPKYA
jgi:hypothetical protein